MGGRGTGSGMSSGGNEISRATRMRTRARVLNVEDMIYPSTGAGFTDQQRTQRINGLISDVINTPSKFVDSKGSLQRIVNWADDHGGSRRFKKLDSLKNAIKRM